MEEKHRHILQTNFVYLTQNLNFAQQICDHLIGDDILTPGMGDSIEKTKQPDQIKKLLSVLPMSGGRAFGSFINALYKTSNKEVAETLIKQEGSESMKYKETADENYDWKRAFTKNRVVILKSLGNPIDVAHELLSMHIFTRSTFDKINQIPIPEHKTREILNMLTYGRTDGVKFLYRAFLNSNNEELAHILDPYVRANERRTNKKEPLFWPPTIEENSEMSVDPVIKITDTKSPWLIHEYGKEYVYQIQNDCRGMVFMINNAAFNKTTIIDANNVEKLFEELHFDVLRKDDLTGEGMETFLRNEADQLEKEQCTECVILIIMSRGEEERIYGVDNVLVELETLIDCFSSAKCPSLHGKPRLVFVQASRTDMNNVTQKQAQWNTTTTGVCDERDSEPFPLKIKEDRSHKELFFEHPQADFLVAYGTTKGKIAWNDEDIGSRFINAIVWSFKYHAHEEELHHLLIRVNRLVGKGGRMQNEMTIANVKSNLRKKFYFFPGIHSNPPKLHV